LSPSYQDSLAISQSFKEKNIPLFVSYYRRSLPRFLQVKKWIDSKSIGEVRHIRWHLSKPTTEQDLSGNYYWRTDSKITTAEYFDDLASHGLDLIVFLLGNIKEVSGMSLNQQGLYSAKDAVSATWLHDSGITGSGS
jgi:1,5-anhydro-D-fructose reductase (1,5-anhydro-D-mannitol-forming)